MMNIAGAVRVRSNARLFSTIILRNPLSGGEMNVAEVRKMKDLDMVFNRVNPTYPYDKFQNLDYLPIISQAYWRNRWTRMKAYMNNTLQASRMLALDKAFDEKYLNTFTFNIFRGLNTGIIVGNTSFFEDNLTESFSKKINFVNNTPPLFLPQEFDLKNNKNLPPNTPFCGRIARLVQKPVLCGADIIYVTRFDSKLCFGQLMYQILTEQTLVYKDDEMIQKYFEKNRKVPTSRRKVAKELVPKIWQQALAGNGKMFYYNTQNGDRTWIKPPGFDTTPVSYNPASGTLGTGQIVQILGPTRCVVENIVVLQKPFFNSNLPWRICDF